MRVHKTALLTLGDVTDGSDGVPGKFSALFRIQELGFMVSGLVWGLSFRGVFVSVGFSIDLCSCGTRGMLLKKDRRQKRNHQIQIQRP